MALSGEFQNYPVNNFGLYCTWSATQSVTGNYSDVTLNVYLHYYTISVGSRSDSTIAINGTSETYTAAAIEDYTSGYKNKLLKTKTVRVNHSSDGTATNIPLSASWRFSGTYSSVYVGTITASTTINLDSIDRTAPTVSFSTSNITASGFKISATSSATSDIWQYSTNGGSSWTQFSTTAGTSASVTLSSLSPNTSYTVKVRARKKSNQVYGTSSAATVKTLGGSVLNSVSTVTADNSTVTISLNVTVYNSSYTHTLTLKNGPSTYLTISGLSWAAGTAARTITLSSTQRSDLLSYMASIKSFTGTFSIATMSGSTQIGSASTATATVQTTSANSAPTLSGFTYKDSYSTTTAITGNDQYFIQGYSKLQVTPGTATVKNGASIANYTATCNGVSVSNTTGAAITVGTVSKSGTVAVVLTVTDSRGYTASVTQNITVVAYASPKVSSVSLRRTNDIETEMQLIFNGSFSPITIASVNKNSLLNVRYRYKLTSASSYGSYTSILSAVTVSGTSFSYSNLELCDLPSNSSYDFHLQICDKLSTAAALDLYFVVPQGTPLVALRKQKVGINTPTPTVALDVVGDAKVSGTLTATTLSGTLAASKLSGTVAISKGGTGATTAATACSNIGALPKSGGTMTGQISRSNNSGMWIYGRDNAIIRGTTNSSTSNFYPLISGKATSGSWDVGVLGSYLYLSYATDTNYNAGTNTTTTAYFNTSGNYSGKAANVTGTVALANGGTGATSAASARTNLGVSVTSLYSGTLSSGSTTFNYGNYNFYVIIGVPKSSSSIMTLVVPKAAITTSVATYQIADEANYLCIKLSYSGSTCTLTIGNASATGSVTKVYGVN